MAVAKKVRTLAGTDVNTKGGAHPATPVNVQELAIALEQLQKSYDELVTRFNAHTHGGVTVGAGTSGAPNSTLVAGTAVATPNLFVPAAS